MVLVLNVLILVFIIGQLIDTVLLAAHHQDFGKIMVGLIALIHMDSFNAVLGIG